MSRLRVLVLAPDCNPESISTPSIGYAQANALGRLHDVTLVVRDVNRAAVQRARGAFRDVIGIRIPVLDTMHAWALRRIFKFDYGRQSLTAATLPVWMAFEWLTWRRLRRRIRSQEFDVVLRILPLVAVIPSPFAHFLRHEPTPFVIGPLNGGLPWPHGFPQLDKQREQAGYGVSGLRELYRYLPFARSTYSRAAAIIAGSSHTYAEFASHEGRVFFVPGENGIDPASFVDRAPAEASRPLQLIFVGRLIPLKACDLALKAAAPLLRRGDAQFTIVGDGPERRALQQLVTELGLQAAVSFEGWLSTEHTMSFLQRSDVLVFPSLREFGGAVIFEALSAGVVPVVADFGGPGDIVNADIGYKLPLVDEATMLSALEHALTRLATDREHLERLRGNGVVHAREHLTWDGKARTVSSILLWVAGRRNKPHLPPPARAVPERATC
jgi:glycosyltransferase involved in cell wall biosynthesis